MSAIFGFTFYIGRMTEVLTPDIYRAHWCKVIVPVMDGFRRYAHARVITDFKNMADYMKSEHWLKASEKAKTKTRTTATRLQETPEKR